MTGNKNVKNIIEKKAFKLFIFGKYDILGKYNRIQLPNCILESIRCDWTDFVWQYMGFKEQRLGVFSKKCMFLTMTVVFRRTKYRCGKRSNYKFVICIYKFLGVK